MFLRSWVWIPAPYTGRSQHVFTYICCKNCNIWLKGRTQTEKRPRMAYLKKLIFIVRDIIFAKSAPKTGHKINNEIINFFLKNGPFRPLFLYFCLFYKQLTVNICSIKVANCWIRTRALRYRKRPLYQLRHNHIEMLGENCPGRAFIRIGHAVQIASPFYSKSAFCNASKDLTHEPIIA